MCQSRLCGISEARAAPLPLRSALPQPPDRLLGNLPWAPRHCGARQLPGRLPGRLFTRPSRLQRHRAARLPSLWQRGVPRLRAAARLAHLRRPAAGRAGRWRPAGSALLPLPPSAASPGSPQCPVCVPVGAARVQGAGRNALRGSGSCSQQPMEVEGSVCGPLSLARGKLLPASLREPDLGLRKR